MKAPVPGPYSTTTRAAGMSTRSSIIRAKAREDGAIAPTCVGRRIHSAKKRAPRWPLALGETKWGKCPLVCAVLVGSSC